jgi:hypothetical protein
MAFVSKPWRLQCQDAAEYLAIQRARLEKADVAMRSCGKASDTDTTIYQSVCRTSAMKVTR